LNVGLDKALLVDKSGSCGAVNIMLGNTSIRVRVVTFSLASLLLIVVAVTGMNVYQNTKLGTVVDEASKEVIFSGIDARLNSLVLERAGQIHNEFSSKYTTLKQLSNQFHSLAVIARQGSVGEETIRLESNDALKTVLSQNPDLLGIWAILEKNAMGTDSQFLSDIKHGSNDTGRFASYWNKASGSMENLPSTEQEIADTKKTASDVPYNYFYTCPSATGKACLMPPFSALISGKTILMTTLSVPVFENDKVIGVVGMDIALDQLQQIAMDAKKQFYDGAGEVTILSDAGFIAASTIDRLQLGSVISANENTFTTKVGEFGNELLKKEDKIFASSSILPEEGIKPWRFVLSVPNSVIQSESDKLRVLQKTLQREATQWSLVVAGIAGLIGSALMWIMASRLTNPINSVAERLKAIAMGDGDLTRRIDYPGKDELGELVGWFNCFLDKLQPTFSSIRDAILDTRETAATSLSIATQASEGMQGQFRDIDQVATASHEMSATAQDVASNASRLAEAAQGADRSAKEGLILVEATRNEFEQLKGELTEAVAEVKRLSGTSDEIEIVLEVIRGVAQQTNLLALNAAIEAARAGESGRGFAVVADDVRGLAMRTQQSVEQIKIVIERLQEGTQNVVVVMQSSHSKAQLGSEMISDTVHSFSSIDGSISLISEMTLQIATAAEEQSAVVEEVSRNIANIRVVTELLNGRTSEATSMSRKLQDLADHQHQLSKQFKT
jgi:methyl-accepting chemotaxis protein